jgi:TonB-dependent starch-binding outer membrane protein SusC
MKKNECIRREIKIPGLQKVLRIMKLTMFLVLLSVVSVFAGKSYSQTKELNLDIKNSTVKEVLKKIEDQSEFVFMYSEKLIDVDRKVSVTFKDNKINDVLDKLFAGTDVNYRVKDRFILLTTPEVTGNDFSVQQQKTVTGTVMDESGEPLPGVTVLVKNTTQGTVTNAKGNYTLTNFPEDAVLVFSFVGMRSHEVPVGNQTTINLTLEEETIGLEEVVAIAYGSSTKRDLTGAVSSISSEDIEKYPATSVAQALQGKTAGLQVTQNSGRPGSSVSVNIRGIGSFGNNEPLYVVDGFPLQDISFINPNDIESISVLKDASAAAIYGVRANAGVVIIATKRGVKGDVGVSIDSWVGIQSKPDQIEMLNAQEFAEFALNVGEAQGKSVLEEWRNPGELNNVNWQDYTFDTGIRHGHNIIIRGGNERSRTALSLGMVDEDGVVITSSYKRYNVGLNSDYEITDNLSVRADLKYTYSENFLELNQGYYGFMKVYSNAPYLTDVTGTSEPYDGKGNYGAFTESALLNSSRNILANALQGDQDNGNKIFLGNLALDYSFLNGFTATGKFGVQSRDYAGWSFSPRYDRGINDNNPVASYNINQNTSLEYLAEGLLKYQRHFGEHRVDFLAGASAQQNQFERVSVTGRGFLNNQIRDMSAADEITGTSGTYGTATFVSTFARAGYSFKQKYYLTATVRRDGVGDRFSRSNLYGTFPSISLGWNIDQEAFMANAGFDLLKLRGSWGETGNSQGIQPFQFLTYYTGGSNSDDSGYVFGGVPVSGLAPQTLANPNLVWESQVQTSIGVDGELLDRRLYFTFDYFEKSAKDFLLEETIPHQTGFTSRAVNAGNVDNNGFEILVGYRNMKGEFTWDVSANFTKIKNEITELTKNQDFLVYDTQFVPNHIDNWLGFTRSYVGGSIGTFYGYRADGIFQTQQEIDALNQLAPDGIYQESTGDNPIAPGDRRFKDLDGNGKITSEDREIIGNPFPDFYGGMDFNASYKNFELGLSFYGSYGNDILNFVKVELESLGQFGNTNAYTNVSKEYFNNRWTTENPSDTYARAVVEDVNRNTRVSDYYVEDGSFLRLRNIQLAYNVSTEVLDKIGFSNLKIYVSGQNLLTITGYSGLDPEIGTVTDVSGRSGVQTRGLDFGSYPNTQTYTLGVNLQF